MMFGYEQSPQYLQSGYSQGYGWGAPQMLGTGFGGPQSMPFTPQGLFGGLLGGAAASSAARALGGGRLAQTLAGRAGNLAGSTFIPFSAGPQASSPIDDIAEDIADDLSKELADRILVATHELLQMQHGSQQVAPLWNWRRTLKNVGTAAGTMAKPVITDAAKNALGQVLTTLQAQPQAAFAPQAMAFGPQQFQPMSAGPQASNPIDDIAEDIADDLSKELADRILVATHELLQMQYGSQQVAPLWNWRRTLKNVGIAAGTTAKTVITDEAKNALGQVLTTLQAQPQAALQPMMTRPW